MSLRSFINPCGSLATKMTLTVTQRLQNWYKTCEFIHCETYLSVLTLDIGNWTKYQTALSLWVTQDVYFTELSWQAFSVLLGTTPFFSPLFILHKFLVFNEEQAQSVRASLPNAFCNWLQSKRYYSPMACITESLVTPSLFICLGYAKVDRNTVRYVIYIVKISNYIQNVLKVEYW